MIQYVKELGGFREERGCVNQIFTQRIIAEKYLERGKKLTVVFMDLEDAFERVDKSDLWQMLGICGTGGKLLKAGQKLCEGAVSVVRVNSVVNSCSDAGVCDVTPVV